MTRKKNEGAKNRHETYTRMSGTKYKLQQHIVYKLFV